MSSTIPPTMKAVVVEGPDQAQIKEVPVPKLEDNQVLVKIAYAASNPTDWKHLAWLSPPGSILGCDYSGTVASIGPNPANQELKVGDRVAGFVHGGKFPNRGSFAEYAVAGSDMLFKVPAGLGADAAATFGIGFFTAAMAIFHHQKTALPPAQRPENEWFLVQGGSTSVGLFTIQLAKIIGYNVVATSSPHSFDLVKSYGADQAVDYHNVDQAIEEIKKVSNGGVTAGLDCTGGEDSTRLAKMSFKSGGGILTTLMAPPESTKEIREDVKAENILLYTAGGYEFEFIPGKVTMPAKPEDKAWYQDFCKRTPALIEQYGIKANPLDKREGIESILPGLKEMKEGKVSGKKLVYRIA